MARPGLSAVRTTSRTTVRLVLTAFLAAVTTAATAATTATAAAPPSPPTTSAGDQVVVVNLVDSSGVSPVAGDARALRLSVRRSMPSARAVSVRVPAGRLDDVVRHLRALPGVRSVDVGVERHLVGTPDDPAYLTQQSAYLGAVNAPAAWNVQHGSSSVRIAVVDSGIDITHPDLAGKVVARYNAADGSTDVSDQLGHGTFVAGVAAAVTNNAIGVAGAGYNSSLLAVKVDDGSGGIPLDYVVAGILWAADHGARVINCSFAGQSSSLAEQNAIAYAQSKGAVVVAAAGNYSQSGNPVVWPAAYPGVIAVGATDAAGHRASFSEHGSWVTVAAPGVGNYSTTPLAGSSFFGASYDHGSGTSFSSPIVAGEVALLAAQSPGASAALLRAAVVESAHGYQGLGLGTGQVDFAAALARFAPTTVPTVTAPLADATTSGSVGITASSTAPAVQFRIDTAVLGPPVPVVSGTAATTWASFGAVNGPHTVTAVDCTLSGICATGSAARTFAVVNTAPAVTAPTSGAALSGTFTLRATAPGGGVAFYIDGSKRAFDGTAPYAVSVNGSTLSDGAHVVVAVGCSAGGSSCHGPSSPAVSFTTRSLHPLMPSVSPNPFSPNRDSRRDTTRVTFGLPQSASVTVRVINQAGVVVRGPLALGTLSAGTHTWVWNGGGNSGLRRPDGTYSVTVSTSKPVGDAVLSGSASRTVRLDTVAPVLAAVQGNGYIFYPYPDGYGDTFTASVRLYEAGQLRLHVYTAAGRPVRTLGANKSPGRVSMTWNGRDAANHLVPAGIYRWKFTATDAASNVRRSSTYLVVVRR